MRLARRGVVALMSFAAFACWPTEAASITVSERAELRLQIGETEKRLRISEDAVTGPQVSLRYSPGQLSGIAFGRPVQLQGSLGRITGTWGESPVRVSMAQMLDGGFELVGRFGEDPVQIRVSPMLVSGAIGPCSYSLPLAGEAYRGWRDCNGGRIPVRTVFRLPAQLVDTRDPTRAGLVLVMLSPHATPPPLDRAEVSSLERFGFSVERAEEGVRVSRVELSSPAAEAGLEEGMRLTHVGQEEVGSPQALEDLLSRVPPESTLMVRAVEVDPTTVRFIALQVPSSATTDRGVGGSGP